MITGKTNRERRNEKTRGEGKRKKSLSSPFEQPHRPEPPYASHATAAPPATASSTPGNVRFPPYICFKRSPPACILLLHAGGGEGKINSPPVSFFLSWARPVLAQPLGLGQTGSGPDQKKHDGLLGRDRPNLSLLG